MSTAATTLWVRRFEGLSDYSVMLDAMRRFTLARRDDTPDEVWLLEHPPLFTLGQAARPEHLKSPGAIPVLRSDRGGQVTYHGPGQLIAYVLLDLRRTSLGIKRLVNLLEQSVLDLLRAHGISGGRRPQAPGVYVNGAKVAALGLRVRNGCTYHGLALNVAMDLSPFGRIDPCGYAGLAVTQLADLGIDLGLREAGQALIDILSRLLDRVPSFESPESPQESRPPSHEAA